MGKILVTGASGHIGALTLRHLLKKGVPADDLIGLARDPAKATELTALGIDVRRGDYGDPASLLAAFAGVEKLMLVSTHAFTDRKTQHANAIAAAVRAGVGHVVYMPILRKAGSKFHLKEVTDEDVFTERTIRDSGLTYTFVQHPPYLETMYAGGPDVLETGLKVTPGTGRTAGATRDDLAAAHAAVLSEPGHENKTYALTGSPALSFAEMADVFSKIAGTRVPLVNVRQAELVTSMVATGLPEFVATFLLGWIDGMNRGEWDQATGDLERLIGREPTTFEQHARSVFVR